MQALGYLALTREQFEDKISNFYMFQTSLGMNILIMTVISFVVGLSISGQTFYTFILENLEKFGALKAIGTKKPRTGTDDSVPGHIYVVSGLWVWELVCARWLTSLAKMRLPDYASRITYGNLGLALVMV